MSRSTYHKKQIMPTQTKVTKRENKELKTNPGDQSKYLAHALEMWDLDRVDYNDPQLVKNRIQWYFEHCRDNDMKPSIEGMAMALGITRAVLINWENEAKVNMNPETTAIVRNARALLNAMMVDYLQNNKINAVAGIFLMKNNYGYSDKTEIEVAPKNLLGEGATNEELQRKYLTNMEEDPQTNKN